MASGGDGSKPWAALFINNRLKETGSEKHVVSPAVSNGHRFVCFYSSEVVQEETKLKNALVGCVFTLQPRLKRICFCASMEEEWFA